MGLSILPSNNGYTCRHCDDRSNNNAFDDEMFFSDARPTEEKHVPILTKVNKSVTSSSSISGKRSHDPVDNALITLIIVQNNEYDSSRQFMYRYVFSGFSFIFQWIFHPTPAPIIVYLMIR